jgi:glutamate-1-semialdehyde aminotransferase
MEQNAALVEQLATKDRLTKTLAEDRDKLRKNVSRLIAKKGNLQSSTKICKNCQVEFVEKENFNWSCRTH